MQLLNDRSLSPIVRKTAFEIALKKDGVDPELAEKVALDTTGKDSFIRIAALPFLTKQDPFPTDAFSSCLTDPETSRNAADTLKNLFASILRSTKDNPVQRKQWMETVSPLIPVLEDLAEQLKDYEAKNAIAALEKVCELETAETP